MSVWYMPSRYGDFRLLDATETTYRDRVEGCVLEVVNATEHEREKLDAFLKVAVERKWTVVKKLGQEERQDILLAVALDEAGKVLLPLLKPADRTITAIKSEGGQLVVHDTAELLALPPAVSGTVVDNATVPGLPEKKDEKKVSVTRPTPSCPQCVPGAVDRASEVLLSFLTPEEHETWAQERRLYVTGGLSGQRYVIAHRHSKLAQRIGRICYDIDAGAVVHFHDNGVPPEEEVLAAKLILEHREPWLRNEATLFASDAPFIFKNPFGDMSDGTWDARVTQDIGNALSMFRS